MSGEQRLGSILFCVLVVIMAISLAAYSFHARMFSSWRIADNRLKQVKLRLAAESALEVAGQVLMRQHQGRTELNDTLQHLAIAEGTDERFTIVATGNEGPTLQLDHSGPNLSALVNLNTLPVDDVETEELMAFLEAVPDVDQAQLQRLLDWLDADDIPRPLGAEKTEYVAQNALPPSNGPFRSLNELTRVLGISERDIWGSDSNRNGVHDSHEGRATSGLAQHFTISSFESNAGFKEKINLNQDDLKNLEEELQARFDSSVARFIVAYRRFGPVEADGTDDAASSAEEASTTSTDHRIRSIYDLIGSKVESDETLESPWTSQEQSLKDDLPTILKECTLYGTPAFPSRLDLRLAPLELIQAVPGLTESAFEEIKRSRDDGDWKEDTSWLLLDGHLDLAAMRKVDRFLTTQGCTYSLQAISYRTQGNDHFRLLGIVFADRDQTFVIDQVDLSKRGPGFSYERLDRGW